MNRQPLTVSGKTLCHRCSDVDTEVKALSMGHMDPMHGPSFSATKEMLPLLLRSHASSRATGTKHAHCLNAFHMAVTATAFSRHPFMQFETPTEGHNSKTYVSNRIAM